MAPPPTTEPAPTDTPDTTAPGDGSTSSTDPGAGDGDGFSQTDAETAGEEPPPADGDGEVAPAGGVIPPDARRAISAIARTAPNDNGALVAGAAALEAAGVPHDDAVRLVYGRFPILGPARWSDDWYMPRWTGTLFRYHLGLDMVAAYGTPVAAPADGVARIATNALGGLTVRVVEPSGTFWYLAHLSGIADGVVDGSPVAVGQVVGYVGDSGNARGGVPHLHFAVHPNGGQPVPPKPIVDQWVADGAALCRSSSPGWSSTPQSAAAVSTGLTRSWPQGRPRPTPRQPSARPAASSCGPPPPTRPAAPSAWPRRPRRRSTNRSTGTSGPPSNRRSTRRGRGRRRRPHACSP